MGGPRSPAKETSKAEEEANAGSRHQTALLPRGLAGNFGMTCGLTRWWGPQREAGARTCLSTLYLKSPLWALSFDATPRPAPRRPRRPTTAGLPALRSLPRHSPRSYTPRRALGSASSRDPREGRAVGEAPGAEGGAFAREGGSGNNEGNFRTGRPRAPEPPDALPPRPLQRPLWTISRLPPSPSVPGAGGTGSLEPAAPARVRLG